MRTPTLQYLYLQKPLLSLLLIAALSVCWIFKGEFYTPEEPKEASVAAAMIEKGDWILPQSYADEVSHTPPFSHWLTAVFSLPQGEVTPLTSRLPSAIAFVCLVGFCFLFYGGRTIREQDAFLMVLIMITCFELHRAAMTAQADMLLTTWIVLGLFSLFRWEEMKGLKSFPCEVPVLLGCAVLTKGLEGVILPLLIFAAYLFLLKYNWKKIAGKLSLIFVLSLILPAIWYLLVYQRDQEALSLIWRENFGSFWKSGHEHSFWYHFQTAIIGFIPWSIFLFFTLFGFRYHFRILPAKMLWKKILKMEKIKLFSLVSILVVFVFYCIPSCKKSVHLMPAYPFIAYYIAQFILYATEYKKNVTKAFGFFTGILGVLIAVVVLLTVITHLVKPEQLFGFIACEHLSAIIGTVWSSFTSFEIAYLFLFCSLVLLLIILFNHLRKKNNIKILYSTIFVYWGMFLIVDGIFLPAYKNGESVKPFAETVESYVGEKEKIYVLDNPEKYKNMYGMNFYLHNRFLNFEKELPEAGFFLIGNKDFEKFYPLYESDYTFQLEVESPKENNDAGQIIQLYSIRKN